VRKACI